MQKDFDNFLSEVVEKLNISNLPKESQDKIIADLGENMFEEVILSSLEILSPEDRDKFTEIEESGDIIAITNFLNEKIPNFKEFAKERAKLVVDAFINALQVK